MFVCVYFVEILDEIVLSIFSIYCKLEIHLKV